VAECNRDTKKLYQLINQITGSQAENPLPEHTSEDELANQFANFFMSKIKKIRDGLEHHKKYEPKETGVAELNSFTPLSQEEVLKVIASMSAKSCELDALPSKLLKEAAPLMISTLTQMINLSLGQGVFPDKWKVAVIRPLLKKAGLDLVESNYRPVSILNFMSKLLEKCALLRFNKQCDLHGLMPT
jgi:hypothetical protein